MVSRGELQFDDVSFRYGASAGPRVIDRLTLQVRPGEKIGLVGRSGAGKSTLVNLLLRFHDVESGRVLIDGQDIAGVTQDSLRAQIGMVTQDTSLLHRSVRDNILYGRPDATEADMVAAAERAEAHDFILGLSDPSGRKGYDAHVGERGVKLSGGQRQRIAIARVMLKDAPILLLDEATSALDSEVEAAIQASLYRLMEGKTVVAIAHRLSTIAAMDRLVVLDKGRIVEMGDHRSLLEQGGLYARLWAHQSGGFLVDDDEDGAPPAGVARRRRCAGRPHADGATRIPVTCVALLRRSVGWPCARRCRRHRRPSRRRAPPPGARARARCRRRPASPAGCWPRRNSSVSAPMRSWRCVASTAATGPRRCDGAAASAASMRVAS